MQLFWAWLWAYTSRGKFSREPSPRLIFPKGSVAHNHDQDIQLIPQFFNHLLLLHTMFWEQLTTLDNTYYVNYHLFSLLHCTTYTHVGTWNVAPKNNCNCGIDCHTFQYWCLFPYNPYMPLIIFIQLYYYTYYTSHIQTVSWTSGVTKMCHNYVSLSFGVHINYAFCWLWNDLLLSLLHLCAVPINSHKTARACSGCTVIQPCHNSLLSAPTSVTRLPTLRHRKTGDAQFHCFMRMWVSLLWKERAYLVRTSEKDTQCFTHKNRETPKKSVELATLQLSNYECNYRHLPFPFAILLWSLGVHIHCLEWDCHKLVIASIGQCTFTCTIIIPSSETCMLCTNLTIVR